MSRADRAVAAVLLTFGAVIGLAAPWLKAPPPDLLWLVVWELVVGFGFAAAGVAILPAPTGWYLAGAAVLLFAAPTVLAGGWSNGSVALWAATITMPVPLGLLRIIRRRPAARLSDALVLGTGVVAAAGTAAGVRDCERLVELDGRLPGFLAGQTTPASPGERTPQPMSHHKSQPQR